MSTRTRDPRGWETSRKSLDMIFINEDPDSPVCCIAERTAQTLDFSDPQNEQLRDTMKDAIQDDTFMLSNPIKVRKNGEGFEVIFGRRRLTMAKYLAKKLGKDMRILTRAVKMSDKEAFLEMIQENTNRKGYSDHELMTLCVRAEAFGLNKSEMQRTFQTNYLKIDNVMNVADMDDSVQDSIQKEILGVTPAQELRHKSRSEQKRIMEEATQIASTSKRNKGKITKAILQEVISDKQQMLRDADKYIEKAMQLYLKADEKSLVRDLRGVLLESRIIDKKEAQTA